MFIAAFKFLYLSDNFFALKLCHYVDILTLCNVYLNAARDIVCHLYNVVHMMIVVLLCQYGRYRLVSGDC